MNYYPKNTLVAARQLNAKNNRRVLLLAVVSMAGYLYFSQSETAPSQQINQAPTKKALHLPTASVNSHATTETEGFASPELPRIETVEVQNSASDIDKNINPINEVSKENKNAFLNIAEALFTMPTSIPLNIPLDEDDLANPLEKLPLAYQAHLSAAISMDISFDIDGIPGTTSINLQSPSMPDIFTTASNAAELYNQRLVERSLVAGVTTPSNFRISKLVIPTQKPHQ